MYKENDHVIVTMNSGRLCKATVLIGTFKDEQGVEMCQAETSDGRRGYFTMDRVRHAKQEAA